MDAKTELTKATKGCYKIIEDISPYSLGRFLFRKMSMSTFSGFKQLLCWLTISPAVEKILSAGTDVAGTQRKRLASLANVGKRLSCLSHLCRGWSSICSVGSFQNSFTSSLPVATGTSSSLESPSKKVIAVSFFFFAGGSWQSWGLSFACICKCNFCTRSNRASCTCVRSSPLINFSSLYQGSTAAAKIGF